MRLLFAWLCLLFIVPTVYSQDREINITLLETTDIHGNYLPYDFLTGQPGRGSMARISTYVNALRNCKGDETVVLLDNGDILQGQPTAYYYNFIDTTSQHICASVLNYLRYDVGTVGNHDIEAGHAVYDRWTKACNYPVLGANAINETSDTAYWKPYTIIERKGLRIAVLGMITPAIPQWLPHTLWSGIRFDDMLETARRYMPNMKREADIVVGLFHSGIGQDKNVLPSAENASAYVAQEVPGFDVVFCGHDHRTADRTVVNVNGDSVKILNPAAGAEAVARADIKVIVDANGQIRSKQVSGGIDNICSLPPDSVFLQHFAPQAEAVRTFTDKVIGYNENAMQTLPAFFGSSAFIDFIHQMQLSISGAEISFAAPLSFDASIGKGDIRVRDMFSLYRYENMLYVMELTGQEIKDYLEYSYAHWTKQMQSPDEHLLLFQPNAEQAAEAWQRLQYPSYNFDSAAGICYTVDVTRPEGEKITITQMADGTPFSLTRTYRCAINSYRGNGGGGLLTEGAHIPAADLSKRIVWSTDKDLRYYMMTTIEQRRTIAPRPLHTWKFVPETWVAKAQVRDMKLLQP